MTERNHDTDNLPPIWNIRAKKNSHFLGRDEEMAALAELLEAEGVCLVEPVDDDVPGLGITTMLREYAYAHTGDYQLVWWLDAEHETSTLIQYLQLGHALELLQQKATSEFNTIDEVRETLAGHKGWLLIVDGIADPSMIVPILPANVNGHVILSAQHPTQDTEHKRLRVGRVAQEDIDRLYPGLSAPAGDASILRTLPMALELLSAFAALSDQSLDVIVENVVAALPENVREQPHLLYQTVLRYTLNHLSKNHPASKDFLALCCYLCPHDIPLSLFEDVEDILTGRLNLGLHDEESFESLVAPLLNLRLISRDDNGLSMHPTIQEAIRSSMGEAPQRAWCNAAVQIVLKSYPIEAVYTRPNSSCVRLMSHALHAADLAEECEVALPDASALLYQVGLYVHAHGLLMQAQMCYLRSINIAERKLGTVHPTVATRVNSLGTVEHELGNLDNAQTCFERAMEICEAVYGPSKEARYANIHDSMLTMPLRNLCKILEEKGNLKRAQRAFEKAMKTFVDVYGWNHSVVAECAHSFGNTWVALDKPSKAQSCFIKAVRAEENAQECDNVALAQYLNSLGIVLLKNENLELAQEQFERALRLNQNNYAEDDIHIARDYLHLGHVYRQRSLFDEAESSYKESLRIYEAQDEDHPKEVAALLLNLGIVLLNNKEAGQARTMLEQALQLQTDRHGEDSLRLVSTLVASGKALDALDASTQARGMYERALELLDAQDSENYGDRTTVLYRLGRSFEGEDNLDEALRHYEHAMNIDSQHAGQDHPSVARDACGMGSVLAKQGDTIVAMGHFTLALDIYERSLGKDHAKTRMVRAKLDKITH